MIDIKTNYTKKRKLKPGFDSHVQSIFHHEASICACQCLGRRHEGTLFCKNAPKYIACINEDLELQFHYKVHTALDIVEEKLSTAGKSTGDLRELLLGLLYSTEELKIFGYVTNTKVKFIIVVDSTNTLLRDNEVRTMFRKLHTAYTDVVCNPFYIPGDVITSKKFDAVVKGILSGN